MKKNLVGMMAAVLLLSACLPAGAENAFVPGKYVGSAAGMNGVVSVEITVDEKRIVDVKADVSKETQSIVADAEEKWISQILTTQSAQIDGVSGATVTSKAIMAATENAIKQAADGQSDGKLKAGTYQATAHGAKHDITVEVTLSESAIENIKILEASDSPYVSESAIEKMPQRILENQSIAADAVTGATMTSSGIRAAVADCLMQAGADLSDWSDEQELAKGEDVYTDVLVVGGGTSGVYAGNIVREALVK